MKLKLKCLLLLSVGLFSMITFAQDRPVTGVVTDNSGIAIPGVNVQIKGKTKNVQTDIDGKFSIPALSTDILVFTYIGLKTEEIKAVNTSIKLKLISGATELEGVVVTALGISRDKKSLGYSSQKLDASQVNSTPATNFLNNLSGKVAGLDIKSNSNFGGSTNIILRGMKSMTGNNQALIVVDGVAISNANLNTEDTKSGRGGFDFGNAASDIDPNNIESINILKGAAATALYGSQAANGAIMITTKKGKKNTSMGISMSSTFSLGLVDKNTLPTYQKVMVRVIQDLVAILMQLYLEIQMLLLLQLEMTHLMAMFLIQTH